MTRPRGDLPFGPPAHSALNLRLALALFGFVVAGGAAVAGFLLGRVLGGFVLAAIAVVALGNAAWVQHRRRQRSRAEGGRHHSLFE
ncbi:hypothetical protein Athai_34110 [Actinocatenispora thailandica]|uniref:Uncharacterized protein n=1 Tax=Actinocatenispora thailandica TaxID=227318 RepID=A0A7R7DQD4_9ACTN|nr:DUF6343 family protein [Actinocatenispora thailandica]BCJ35908.1 hypothetical protein Athai_34110 [Actinocatenispora thailandica]